MVELFIVLSIQVLSVGRILAAATAAAAGVAVKKDDGADDHAVFEAVFKAVFEGVLAWGDVGDCICCQNVC